MTQILESATTHRCKDAEFQTISPGSGFEWKHARTGSGEFDFTYQKSEDRVTASVTSRVDYEVNLVLTLVTEGLPEFTDRGINAGLRKWNFWETAVRFIRWY